MRLKELIEMKKKLEEMYEQSFSSDEPMNITCSAPTDIEDTESLSVGNSASTLSMVTLKPGEIYTECEANIDLGGYNNYYDTRQDYDNFNVNNYGKNYRNNYDQEESYNNCDMSSYGENYDENKYYDSCRMESYDERNVRECCGLGYGKDYSKNYVKNVGAEIRNEGYNLYGWNNANYAYQRSRTDNQGILIIIVILLWFCCSPGIWL